MKGLILALNLPLLVSFVVGTYEIRHIEINGAHFIDTNPHNYAFSGPSNYRTVSINGNKFNLTTASCQTTSKDIQTLSLPEKYMLNNELLQYYNIDTAPIEQQIRSTRFSMDGSTSQTSRGNSDILISNGISISKSDESNFSISKRDLPNNIARVFVMRDVVAFVHYDGLVKMTPVDCLQPDQQLLLERLKLDIQQVEQNSGKNSTNVIDNKQPNSNFQQSFNPNLNVQPQDHTSIGFKYGASYIASMLPFQTSFPYVINNIPFISSLW